MGRPQAATALVAVVTVVAIAAAGCAGAPDAPATSGPTSGPAATTPPPPPPPGPRSDPPTVADLDAGAGQVQDRLLCALDALEASRWGEARTCVQQARDTARLVMGYLLGHRDGLTPEDYAAYEAHGQWAWPLADAFAAAAGWGETEAMSRPAAARMDAAGWPHAAALELGVPGAHAAQRGLDEAAAGAEAFADRHARLAGLLGMEAAAGRIGQRARALEASAGQAEGLLQEAGGRGFVPAAGRELSPPRSGQGDPAPAGTLAAHFGSFDADADGRADVAEALAFFAWVEANVRVRLDDEGEPFPVPGSEPGDGRVGSHHLQSAEATWQERAGDGEDLAALAAAFHAHFGRAAYVAFLDGPFEGAPARAVAAVHVGSAGEFEQRIGALPRYEVPAANDWGVPGGAYLVIDHRGASALGWLGGREPLPPLRALHDPASAGNVAAE